LTQHHNTPHSEDLKLKSQISLWRIDGNPPHGEVKTCSTENGFPHIHKFEAGSQAANPILNKGHHKTPLSIKQTHTQQLAADKALR